MTTPSRRFLLTGLLAAALPPAVARAQNDRWPLRTVRLVTLAAPGGGTDAVARVLTEALAAKWGQPVIVENRPGGEGIVSVEAFLAGREGNHTMLFNPVGVWTALHLMHEHLSFDTARDLLPVSMVVQDFLALAASPRLPAVSLAEIVAMAKSEPGKLTWACAPSVPWLAFTAFLKANGLVLTYVPYRNPIASLPDLAEGRVDLAFLPLAPMVGPSQAGKLRLVAVAGDDRAPLALQVPTAREAGFPSLSLGGGHCLFAPREMPEALRRRIAADVAAVVSQEEVGRRLVAMGYPPRALDGPPLADFLNGERQRWKEVVEAYGAKPQP
jgi:tripartite-type tricarboxylate transporter receptor subunit TctC